MKSIQLGFYGVLLWITIMIALWKFIIVGIN